MKQCENYQEIQALADAICDEQASSEQIARLEQLLKGNPEAQEFYADYVDMHIQLLSAADNNFEYVYRRMERERTEEFILRPNNSDNVVSSVSSEISAVSSEINNEKVIPATEAENNETKPTNSASSQSETNANKVAPTGNKLPLSKVIGTVVLGFIITLLTWQVLNRAPSQYYAEILEGHFSIVELGHIDGQYLSAGEYQTTQAAKLRLNSGETLSLAAQSIIKLLNNTEIILKQGAIELAAIPHNNMVIHAQNFSLYSNGSNLSLDLTSNTPEVISGHNTLLLPNDWRPKHYWSFDGNSDRSIDSAGSAHGISTSGVSRVKGLLGQGAFHFDNTRNARINVGSGGGTAPATGSFSVTDGVTIEALISPQYSAIIGDIDEVFRKDQTDGELRMLVAFQNDRGKKYLKPEGEFAESISFGLYLVGQGYHELKLPLDGKNGRPTLAALKKGNTHHVAATYSVSSGLKAIYLDGVMLAHYQYPAGSKMLSGGSGTANIGNSPIHPKSKMTYFNEAFSGVIDEVAFYDFALPPFMINQHFQHIQQGYNYYGLVPSTEVLPKQIKISLPENSKITLSPDSGLPFQVINTSSLSTSNDE